MKDSGDARLVMIIRAALPSHRVKDRNGATHNQPFASAIAVDSATSGAVCRCGSICAAPEGASAIALDAAIASTAVVAL